MGQEIKLDKPQVRIFAGLMIQREELQKSFQEVVDAEKQQIELLVKHYNLEDGEYIVKQVGDDVYLQKREPTAAPSSQKK